MKQTLLHVYIRANIYSVAWILASKLTFKNSDVLQNGKTVSKSVQNYLLPNVFLIIQSQTFVLLPRSICHVNKLLGWSWFILHQPFVCHLRSFPDCIAQCFREWANWTKSCAMIGYPRGRDSTTCILPTRDDTLYPTRKISPKPKQKPNNKFLLVCLWTSTPSRSINTQKRTWPISSHLDHISCNSLYT